VVVLLTRFILLASIQITQGTVAKFYRWGG